MEGYYDYEKFNERMEEKSLSKKSPGAALGDEFLDDGECQTIIPSSICQVIVLSHNKELPSMKRFKVITRDKESQKVSLALYREESKKIFDILRRYSDLVEKASCDEAFIDVTKEINAKYEHLMSDPYSTDQIFPKTDQEATLDHWRNAYFLGHKGLGDGLFTPRTPWDRKLFLANDIAYRMRRAIDEELSYKASCGISHNMTLAKLASA